MVKIHEATIIEIIIEEVEGTTFIEMEIGEEEVVEVEEVGMEIVAVTGTEVVEALTTVQAETITSTALTKALALVVATPTVTGEATREATEVVATPTGTGEATEEEKKLTCPQTSKSFGKTAHVTPSK
jgi:hypothetical protein